MAALSNVWASWLRVVPHWLTSLTEPAMALRSVTLWARSAARAFAACCCAGRVDVALAEAPALPRPVLAEAPALAAAWAEGPAAAPE